MGLLPRHLLPRVRQSVKEAQEIRELLNRNVEEMSGGGSCFDGRVGGRSVNFAVDSAKIFSIYVLQMIYVPQKCLIRGPNAPICLERGCVAATPMVHTPN